MANPHWKRKSGTQRSIGNRRLEQWTHKRAHRFAMQRVADIKGLLAEIEMVYDDVDMYIVRACEELRLMGMKEIEDGIEEALRTGLDGRELGHDDMFG